MAQSTHVIHASISSPSTNALRADPLFGAKT
ncbi:Uncharacterised protein [Vibrio cholerae]|nr:Uncharacterised protein [Vibrio cholerae]